MRLITWNCRVGGFRKKAKHLAGFRPDILIVQEVEPIDGVLLLAGDCQPTYRDRLADPAFPRRAIGVFSYTDTTLKPVDEAAPSYWFRRYEALAGGAMFNVVGVWTWSTKLAKTSYRQAHQGLQDHADWIQQRPTIVLGDFNMSASFPGKRWNDLMALFDKAGLVSAYHTWFKEPYGAETRWTHFHRGKESHSFHVDYCFLPAGLASQIRQVELGCYADWNTISDHVPLIVDIDL